MIVYDWLAMTVSIPAPDPAQLLPAKNDWLYTSTRYNRQGQVQVHQGHGHQGHPVCLRKGTCQVTYIKEAAQST